MSSTDNHLHKHLLSKCFSLPEKINLFVFFLIARIIHGGTFVTEVKALMEAGASLDFVLEQGDHLPCHCPECVNVLKPVCAAVIIAALPAQSPFRSLLKLG